MLIALITIMFLLGIAYGEIICTGENLRMNEKYYETLINSNISCSVSLNYSANITWFLNETMIGEGNNVSFTLDSKGYYLLKALIEYNQTINKLESKILAYKQLTVYRTILRDEIQGKILINTTSTNISKIYVAYDAIKNVQKGFGYQYLTILSYYDGCLENVILYINNKKSAVKITTTDNTLNIKIRDLLKPYNTYNLTINLISCFNVSINITINNIYVFLYLIDDIDNVVRLYAPPSRVVVLAPSIYEMFLALNLTDKIVGADKYSITTNTTKVCADLRMLGIYSTCIKPNITNVGGVVDFNIETIVGLDPDIVFATGINVNLAKERLKRLVELNITLFVKKPQKITDIFDYINIIGIIFNIDNHESVVNNLKKEVQKVIASSNKIKEEQKPKILYVVWYKPIYTTGRYTFANDIIELAGGINIFRDILDKEWFAASYEEIIMRNPDLIICSGMGNVGNFICSNISKDKKLRTVTAVKNNKLFTIPDSNWIERTGPRIVLALKWLHEIVKKNLKKTVSNIEGTRSVTIDDTFKKEEKIFKEKIQEFSNIEDVIKNKFKYKTGYISKPIFAPLLVLDKKYPYVEYMEYKKELDENLFEYNYRIIIEKYYYTSTLIVTRSDLEVDSYASLILAKKLKAPIVFINGSKIPEEIKEIIGSLPNLKKVIIIGGNIAVPEIIEKEISKVRNVKMERIFGETRIETSIKIAEKYVSDKVVITGYDASLKSLLISIEYGAPIIYTNWYKIDIVTEFLKKHKPKILFVDIDEELKKEILKRIVEFYY